MNPEEYFCHKHVPLWPPLTATRLKCDQRMKFTISIRNFCLLEEGKKKKKSGITNKKLCWNVKPKWRIDCWRHAWNTENESKWASDEWIRSHQGSGGINDGQQCDSKTSGTWHTMIKMIMLFNFIFGSLATRELDWRGVEWGAGLEGAGWMLTEEREKLVRSALCWRVFYAVLEASTAAES